MFKKKYKYFLIFVCAISSFLLGHYMGIHKGYKLSVKSNLSLNLAEKTMYFKKIDKGECEDMASLLKTTIHTNLREYQIHKQSKPLRDKIQLYWLISTEGLALSQAEKKY